MLKTVRDDSTILVPQPDHAMVSGYLAAHWGNDEFARPGDYGEVADPHALREEVVFAIAQHDNGWWDWEASPEIDPADGLPLGLVDAMHDPKQGMTHWRNGIARFPQRPMASLLICYHARCLYAVRTEGGLRPELIHPLYWDQPEELVGGSPREGEVAFVAELDGMRDELRNRLAADALTASWIQPEVFEPNGRLLQILDAMSLGLCSDLVPGRGGTREGLGRDAYELHHVPRRSWDDRVTIDVLPMGDSRIKLDPYPFDVDPLVVSVPARVVRVARRKGRDVLMEQLGTVIEVIDYQYFAR